MPESSTYTYGGSLPLSLDQQLDAAYARTNGDAAAAARLFLRWAESDSQIRDLIPPVVESYIEQRMKQRAKAKK